MEKEGEGSCVDPRLADSGTGLDTAAGGGTSGDGSIVGGDTAGEGGVQMIDEVDLFVSPPGIAHVLAHAANAPTAKTTTMGAHSTTAAAGGGGGGGGGGGKAAAAVAAKSSSSVKSSGKAKSMVTSAAQVQGLGLGLGLGEGQGQGQGHVIPTAPGSSTIMRYEPLVPPTFSHNLSQPPTSTSILSHPSQPIDPSIRRTHTHDFMIYYPKHTFC